MTTYTGIPEGIIVVNVYDVLEAGFSNITLPAVKDKTYNIVYPVYSEITTDEGIIVIRH